MLLLPGHEGGLLFEEPDGSRPRTMRQEGEKKKKSCVIILIPNKNKKREGMKGCNALPHGICEEEQEQEQGGQRGRGRSR